jgi:hypothetical protein
LPRCKWLRVSLILCITALLYSRGEDFISAVCGGQWLTG